MNDLFAGVESSGVRGGDRPFRRFSITRSMVLTFRNVPLLGFLKRPVRRMRGCVVGEGFLPRPSISTTRRQENKAIQKPPMSKQTSYSALVAELLPQISSRLEHALQVQSSNDSIERDRVPFFHTERHYFSEKNSEIQHGANRREPP